MHPLLKVIIASAYLNPSLLTTRVSRQEIKQALTNMTFRRGWWFVEQCYYYSSKPQY